MGGGGVMQTRAHRRPELPRPLLLRSSHQLPTFAAGALCQGFSVAIQRALAALGNVVISRVMGCVMRQPPIRSIKEWHQFIPTRVLQPSPKTVPGTDTSAASPRGSRAWGWGAGLPGSGLLSHSSDFSL